MTMLEVDHLYKAFATTDSGVNLVLSDINFQIEEGEIICIVGPSGCGKSTLLRLISGLTPTSSGQIKLNDQKIEGTSPNRGMVFQSPTLFPWLTVEDNIKFSSKLKKLDNQKEVNRLIDLVGLSGYENYYPSQLSGGMAQRVALARTMINRPDVFLLDEPLGALDAFTRASLQDELVQLWQSIHNLMIMVTHDVEEAVYMASKVIIMKSHPGRVQKILPIDLAYPRSRTSPSFTNYRRQIMDDLNF